MATQFFKRSSWYWQRCHRNGNAQEEEGEGEGAEAEGQEGQRGGEEEEDGEGNTQQRSRKTRGHSNTCMGIAVLFGWMFSERRHLTSFTRLYNALGFDCLVCHSHPLNLFFPSMASTLALSVLDELLRDLERQRRTVVLVVFSGGHKACFYIIIQILLGQCRAVNYSKDKFKVVAESIAGIIFDSSPVEFESSIGAKVLSQQVLTLEPGRSKALILRGAHAVGRGLDFLFSEQLGLQRKDMWRALYSCVNVGPMLILCGEEDELAPFETIHIFSSNFRRLGGRIDVVVWKDSKHVGHFRRYPDQYSREVKKLLMDAVSTYSLRNQQPSNCMATWADLPETVVAEIHRLSKLPHLQLKMDKHVDDAVQGGPVQSKHVPSKDDGNAGSVISQKYACRSRL